MGAAKKYKHIYTQGAPKKDESSNHDDKKMIEAYIKKIEQMLQDPKMQKKASLILENLINKKGPK